LLFEPPKQREFGDLSVECRHALGEEREKTAASAGRSDSQKTFDDVGGILARMEIAGPGFLNFAFAPKFYFQQLRVIDAGTNSQLDIGQGQKVQVEFASVNPTGPLHVGHGRVAVIGDVLARLHEATGFDVEREYYVNDAGNQMENWVCRFTRATGKRSASKSSFPKAAIPAITSKTGCRSEGARRR
jgi:arginyl-tRNA synthetase